MTNLITVPTFTFNQGDIFEGAEPPVQVCFYNGTDDKALIEISQEGRYVNFTSIDELKQLVKLIQKHLPEAEHKLNK